jgi:6-phosphogluconolactonase (cycloisomerase 2 family)
MRMKSRWVLAGLAVCAVFAWDSCINSSSAPANTSFMWVATQGDQMVRTYTINQQTGAIALVGSNGSPVKAGVQPVAMAITSDHKTLFIVNSDPNSAAGNITAYTFNANGSLATAGSGVATGKDPVALAIDPGGKFLFVANRGTSGDPTSGTISVFSISGTNLTPVAGSPFLTEVTGDVSGTGPSAVAVSPAGSFVYVANQFSNTVQSFSFDSSGALSLIASYAAGANPSGLAFSRCAGVSSSTTTGSCPAADDNNLFVANSGSNDITIFTACIQVASGCSSPNGTLSQISPGSPAAAGLAPAQILVDPSADFVYAVDRGSSQVSAYGYSPATGVLSSLGAGSGGASVFAGGITSNAADNLKSFNWIVVTNNGASSVSVFRIGASGKLTGLSSGPFAVQGQPSAILLR